MKPRRARGVGPVDALALGLALGVGGGLTPGPLQALLVAETLRGGPRAG